MWRRSAPALLPSHLLQCTRKILTVVVKQQKHQFHQKHITRFLNAAAKGSNSTVLNPLMSGIPFVEQSLEKHGIFDRHLFRQRPWMVATEELESLTTSLQNAASSQNAILLVALSERVPQFETQVASLRKNLSLSQTVLFKITIQEYVTRGIKTWQSGVNDEWLLTVLRALYYTSWLTGDTLESTSLDTVNTLEKAVSFHYNQLSLTTWCQFMQWWLAVDTQSSKVGKLFLKSIVPTCKSFKDVMAVSTLFPRISGRFQYNHWVALEGHFVNIAMQDLKAWYDNEEIMAVLCYGLKGIQKSLHPIDRRLFSLVLDIIVHNVKHENALELSEASQICVKYVAATVDQSSFEKQSDKLRKFFSSMESVYLRLSSLSPISGLQLLVAMVRSRHVNVLVAEEFVQQSAKIDWGEHKFVEVKPFYNSVNKCNNTIWDMIML